MGTGRIDLCLVRMIDLDMTISDLVVTMMTDLDWWMLALILDLDLMTMIDHDMTMIDLDMTMSLIQ